MVYGAWCNPVMVVDLPKIVCISPDFDFCPAMRRTYQLYVGRNIGIDEKSAVAYK